VPDQSPGSAFRTAFSFVLPVIVGCERLTGFAGLVTTSVRAEVAEATPTALRAVTTTTMV
jgi:hypothetical protein